MGFIGLTLTKAGRRLIASAISEEDPLNITHIQLGEGICEGTFAEMKGLAKKVMEIPVKSVKRDEGKVIVNCDFNSTEAPKGFYFREVGIIGNGVLCYYDNSGDDAEYIDPETETVVKQKRLRFTISVSDDVEVTTMIPSGLYAMEAEVEEELEKFRDRCDEFEEETAENLETKLDKTGDSSETTVTFSQASQRENISAGEKLSALFGKIGKWLSDLKTVAFTGKYEDLSGTPEIPTVGNGTITIKQAGAVIGSFTTNQAGNAEIELTDNNTTYSAATQSANGLMSAADKKKLDGVAASANNYSLPLAAAGTRGGAKIGYSQNGKNYPVQLSGEKMYVNVPWTDTNTWRGIQDNLTSTDTDKSLSAKQGKVLNDKFANYLPLTGGTVNGTVKVRNPSYPNAGVDVRVDSEGANITLHTKTAGKHYEIDTCGDRFRIYQNVNGAITTLMEVDADSKSNINGRAETAVSLTPRTIVSFEMASGMTTGVGWLNQYLTAGPVYLMVVDTKSQYGKSYYTLRFTTIDSPYFNANLLCGADVVKISYSSGYSFAKLSNGPTANKYEVRFYKLLEI